MSLRRLGSLPNARLRTALPATILQMLRRRAHALSILFRTKPWVGADRRTSRGPMGHVRLGTPKTHKWEHVVGLIAGEADVERIAAASADAAEHGLEQASQDQGLRMRLAAHRPAGRPADQLCGSDCGNWTERFEQADSSGGCRSVHQRGRSPCSRKRQAKRSRRIQHAAADTLTSLAGRELQAFWTDRG